MQNKKPTIGPGIACLIWAVVTIAIGSIIENSMDRVMSASEGVLTYAIILVPLPFIWFGIKKKQREAEEEARRLAEANVRAREEQEKRKVEEARRAHEAELRAIEDKRRIELAEQRKKEKEEKERKERELRQLIEETKIKQAEADAKMAQSDLVHEIACCIVPAFRRIIEKADRETHMKVRARFSIIVRKDTIDYYDPTDPQSTSQFEFEEEGISEKLNPIMRKALCKALVSEIRSIIIEEYPTDPNGQKVQVGLEGEVSLTGSGHSTENSFNLPEYNDNSTATATVLYQTFIDKEEKRF